MKYIILELKVQWPMSTTSETYNGSNNIFRYLTKCLFYNKHEAGLFTDENVKYELTEELSIHVKFKKILKLH